MYHGNWINDEYKCLPMNMIKTPKNRQKPEIISINASFVNDNVVEGKLMEISFVITTFWIIVRTMVMK